MKCGYCGTRLSFDPIGRVGKRILKQRPPPGAEDENRILGQGWWYQRIEPKKCGRCGADDPQPYED